MMMSSNGNTFRVTGPLSGNSLVTSEFPSQKSVTWSLDVFFDLRVNKRLSKQSRRQWFETKPCSLWRRCNDYFSFNSQNAVRFQKSVLPIISLPIVNAVSWSVKTCLKSSTAKEKMSDYIVWFYVDVIIYSCPKCIAELRHWGRDKMATNSQMTFSNAFSLMKI